MTTQNIPDVISETDYEQLFRLADYVKQLEVRDYSEAEMLARLTHPSQDITKEIRDVVPYLLAPVLRNELDAEESLEVLHSEILVEANARQPRRRSTTDKYGSPHLPRLMTTLQART